MGKEYPPSEVNGKKVEIKILGYNNGGNSDYKGDYLINGNVDFESNERGSFLFNTSRYVEFEVKSPVFLWGIGVQYSDGGGSTPKNLIFERKNLNGDYDFYKESETKDNKTWYELGYFDSGVYKMSTNSNYASLNEIFAESKFNTVFLIKTSKEIITLSENRDKLIIPNIENVENITQEQYLKYGRNDIDGYDKPIDEVEMEMEKDGALGEGWVYSRKVNRDEFKINGIEVR